MSNWSKAPLNNLENGIKVRRKLLDALHDDSLMARKRDEESALRAAREPHRRRSLAADRVGVRSRTRPLPALHLHRRSGAGFNTILFRYARLLVRGADERLKPNTDRLREFTDAALPRIEQQLYARCRSTPRSKSLTLSFSLQRMREWLGPDDPLVRSLLTKESPDSLATRLVAETKLDDPAVRKQLWDGGKAAVDASRDPMIELARSLDGASRSIRKQFEDEVEAPIAAASETIAAAALQGLRHPACTRTPLSRCV